METLDVRKLLAEAVGTALLAGVIAAVAHRYFFPPQVVTPAAAARPAGPPRTSPKPAPRGRR